MSDSDSDNDDRDIQSVEGPLDDDGSSLCLLIIGCLTWNFWMKNHV